MSDGRPPYDQNETPEDVATLYSWANLHGAKYRDFSAARAQTREKARLRVQQAIEEEQARAQQAIPPYPGTDLTVPAQSLPDSSRPEAVRFEAARFEEQARAEEDRRRAEEAAQLAAQQAAERTAQLAAQEAAQLAALHAAQLAAQRAAQQLEQFAARQAAQQAAEQAAQQAAELAAQRAAEQAAAQQAAEQAARQAAAEEAARQHAAQLAAEEAARQQAAEEAARQQAAEEAARQQAAEEAARQHAAQLAAEEAARQQAAEEAARQQAAEEAARQHAAQLAAEEAARQQAAAEEAARQQAAEEAARQQAAEEAARQHAAQLAAEEAARQQAAEETARQHAAQLAAEEAARQQAAEETARQHAAQLAAEEAARQQAAEEAARQQAAEEAARQHAAQLAAEEAARQQAAQQAAEEAARQQAAEKLARQQAAEHAMREAQAAARRAALEQAEAEQQAAEQAEREAHAAARRAALEQAEAAQEAARQAALDQPSPERIAPIHAAETGPRVPLPFDFPGYVPPLSQRAVPAQSQYPPMREDDYPLPPVPSQVLADAAEQRDNAGRPAWLMPDRPEAAGHAASHASVPLPPDDTLQGSRERLASRWYALRSVFDSTGAPAEAAPAPVAARAPVVAIFSLAGGVGKTSLVATLGRALSARGERVLLVDTAAYGLLPFFFGARDQRPGLLRTFSPPGASGDAPIQLVTFDPESLGPETAPQEALAAEIGKHARGVSRVIVDLATASGATTRRIVRLAPLVVVPMIPDMNSVVSVSSIDSFFQHNGNPAMKQPLPFYVLNQFDPTLPLHLDIREVLREQLGDRLLPFVLRRAPAVSEALAEGMTVMDYAPNSTVAEDFGSLAGWVKSQSAPASTTYRGVRWSER